jgi:hypothetical protein
VLDDMAVIDLLVSYLHLYRPVDGLLSPTDLLFPGGERVLRRSFYRAQHALGADVYALGLSWHSHRRGGATALWIAALQAEPIAPTVVLDTILFRGRWAVAPSARDYLKAGLSLLLDQSLAPHTVQRLQLFAQLLDSQILALRTTSRSPPSVAVHCTRSPRERGSSPLPPAGKQADDPDIALATC